MGERRFQQSRCFSLIAPLAPFLTSFPPTPYARNVRFCTVLLIFCWFILGAGAARAQTNAPPRAMPVNPDDMTNVAPESIPAIPQPVPNGVNVHWYGHGFIYLTSSVGVRAAIDPFGPDT